MFEPAVVDPVVDFLAGLAGEGRALELGIGTGRIALPLARRGVPVHGIELSNAMAARLREKPGGRRGRRHDRRLRDDDRGRCVRGRLPRLQHDHEPDHAGRAGRLLPERRSASRAGWLLRRRGDGSRAHNDCVPPGDTFRVFDSSETHWGIDEYDVANQGLVSHHFDLADGRFELLSMPFRYVWPAELDLMAELAGMRLRERWGGWQREPFTEREPPARVGLGEMKRAGSAPARFDDPGRTKRPKGRFVRGGWGGGSP